MKSVESEKLYTGMHDGLWDSELDSTSSISSVKYEPLQGDGHLSIWDFAFNNETVAANSRIQLHKNTDFLDQNEPLADFDFYKKNNDRLELLIRKYSETTSANYAKEESARLRILNRQIELANQRFKELEFAAVGAIFSHIETLQSFKTGDS